MVKAFALYLHPERQLCQSLPEHTYKRSHSPTHMQQSPKARGGGEESVVRQWTLYRLTHEEWKKTSACSWNGMLMQIVLKSTSEEEKKATGESSRYGVAEVCVCSCMHTCVCLWEKEREREGESSQQCCEGMKVCGLDTTKAGALVWIKYAGRGPPLHKHKQSANEELAQSRSLLIVLPVLASFN